MGDDLAPTQRKQIHRNTKLVSLPLPSVNQPVSTQLEEELTGDQLWDKWEAEASRQTLTKAGWDSFMAEKALEARRKIDPGTMHVKYGGKPSPNNAEMLKRLLEEVEDRFPRRERK